MDCFEIYLLGALVMGTWLVVKANEDGSADSEAVPAIAIMTLLWPVFALGCAITAAVDTARGRSV